MVPASRWKQGLLGEAAPLIESLKSKTHLMIMFAYRKNLARLSLDLLFKDSSEATKRFCQSD